MGIGEKNFSLPTANFFYLSSFICFYFQLFSRVLCEILNLGRLAHKAIAGSRLHVVKGAPHGFNLSHAREFNKVLLEFLAG